LYKSFTQNEYASVRICVQVAAEAGRMVSSSTSQEEDKETRFTSVPLTVRQLTFVSQWTMFVLFLCCSNQGPM